MERGMGRSGRGLREIGEIAVGDPLIEAERFERRHRRIVVVDRQLAGLELVDRVAIGIEPGLPSLAWGSPPRLS
jgi:hypothetical protein